MKEKDKYNPNYTKEFKMDVVKYYQDNNFTQEEVAKKFGITRTSVANWIRELKQYSKEDAFVGSGNLHKEDEELRKIKRQLKDVQEENEILKKAMAIFSRGI